MVLTEKADDYNAWHESKMYRKRFEITETFLASKDFERRVLRRNEQAKTDKQVLKGPKWLNY